MAAPNSEAAMLADAAMRALDAARTSTGPSVRELADARPVLLVFLRHFGCTFCREALADLRAQLDAIAGAWQGNARAAGQGAGVVAGREGEDAAVSPRVCPVLVHMATPEYAREWLGRYGLADVAAVSDPAKELYRAMGLARGSLWQLFGPKSFIRGVKAGLIDGHLVGKLVGDGFQMPGVFVVYRGRLLASFVHQSAADRPDYAGLARSGLSGAGAGGVGGGLAEVAETCPLPTRGSGG